MAGHGKDVWATVSAIVIPSISEVATIRPMMDLMI
jgi:hypothetical protein